MAKPLGDGMSDTQKKWLKVVFIGFLLIIVGFLFLEWNVTQSEKGSQQKHPHAANEPTYTLPVITIDMKQDEHIRQSKQGVISNEVDAKINVYDEKENHLSDPVSEKYQGKIRIRGNSTRLVPKKQYKINLLTKKGKESPESFLGLPPNNAWVLNGPFEDKSFIRNSLAYTVGRKIMGWAPRTKFCEVFIRKANEKGKMDQYYKGIYVLTESIDRDAKRVNIHKTDKNSPVTSFIIQNNRPRPTDTILHSYGYENYLYDYPYMIVYPGKEKRTPEQEDYIEQTLSLVERSLYKDTKKETYQNYIDVDSFVDYYIINEFFKNTDAGMLSTYMYKDYGQKIKAGPLWDFNASMGNSSLLSPYFDYKGFYNNRTTLFSALLGKKSFVKKVIHRYKELRKTYLSTPYLMNLISYQVDLLGNAPARNFEVWPFWACNQFEMFKQYQDVFFKMGDDFPKIEAFLKKHPNYKQPTANMSDTYAEEIKNLRIFITNRGQWLDKNIHYLEEFLKEKNEAEE